MARVVKQTPSSSSFQVWISAVSMLLAAAAAAAATGEDDSCAGLPDPLTLRSDQLTVLVNGYSEARLHLLRSLAVSYSTLPFVADVLILWGNPSTPSATLRRLSDGIAAASAGAPITIHRNPTASLNARFLPRREIRTRAIAACDDDVEIDPASLALAFSVWKTNRDRIVGFFARSHDLDLARRAWIYTIHPDRYSIVLTKFMILSTEYLRRYSCDGGGEAMAAARAVVEEARNCEDILMNFVVAKETGKGPVMVGGKSVRDWGDVRNEEAAGVGDHRRVTAAAVRDVGLSAKEDHRKRRGECIGEFHRVLGGMPLRYSYGKVVEGVGEQGLCRKKGGKLLPCDRQYQ